MEVHCEAISIQYHNEWSEGIALACLDFLLLFNQVKSKREKQKHLVTTTTVMLNSFQHLTYRVNY